MQEAATLDAVGPDQCSIDYLSQYQFSHNPLPLSLGYPLNKPTCLQRLHQESVASLAGVRGFDVPITMNEMPTTIRNHVSVPLDETIEFLKRDVLNVALRNTDNHAQNTAVQRLTNGRVQLTPVFDFAPMFLDPEIVPRTSRWAAADGRTRLKSRTHEVDMALRD